MISMSKNSRLADAVATEDNFAIEKTAIDSFHGKTRFYCRDCREWVPVAFHHKGKMRSPHDSKEIIYVDYLADELDHTLLEMSH